LLGEIVTAASEVNRLIQHIANATREQTDTSQSTAVAMEKISQISESNNARMGALARAARNLNGITNDLQTLVDRFRSGLKSAASTGNQTIREGCDGAAF
jgi:methyl-accepting chemotaxis protein